MATAATMFGRQVCVANIDSKATVVWRRRWGLAPADTVAKHRGVALSVSLSSERS